jgi:hypothetical protein
MTAKGILAVLLIVLGIAVLVYSGLSYQAPGESINIFGLSIAPPGSHYIPSAAGLILLVGGIVLLLGKPKTIW